MAVLIFSPSITTPNGTPTLTVASGSSGSGTDILTWTYQGNDDIGFELEEEDSSIGENFHNILNPGAVGTTGTGTTTVSVIAGDVYFFRIRADHADGTVSPYVGASPVTAGLATGPALSVTSINPRGANINDLLVSWSGASAQGVQVQVQGDFLPGGPQWYNAQMQPNNGTLTNSGAAAGGQGYFIEYGSFGPGNYTFRVRSYDASGNLTQWSQPASGTWSDKVDTTVTPAVLSVSSSGSSITVTWQHTDGSTGVGPLLMQQDGISGDISQGVFPVAAVNGSYDSNGNYTGVISNLTPGVRYDFCLWTEPNDVPEEPAYSRASIVVGGSPSGTVPAAPSGAVGTWGVHNEAGIFLHWHNNSNNETSFWIYRSVGSSFNMINAALVGKVGADISTFDDANADPTQMNNYEIFAVNAANTPTPPATMPTTQPATAQAQGGAWYVNAKAYIRRASGIPVAAELDVYIDGPGPAPKVYQTVAASGTPLTFNEILAEENDHGGANEFNGAIPDNPQGKANVVTPGLEQIFGPGPFAHNTNIHWIFIDNPSFLIPPYAWNFTGTKTFVTTVKDPAGNVLKVIKWHLSRTAGLRGLPNTTLLSVSIDS